MYRFQAMILAVLLSLVWAPGQGTAATPFRLANRAATIGRVLLVGPRRQYAVPSQAAAAAQDGDTIEIDAGSYPNDWTTWDVNNLTIRAVGGVAQLTSSELIPNRKAIWVIRGQNTTVEGIEFSGARVIDRNGAGIRQEGDGLTVRSCSFHDNENGILTVGSSTSDITIEYSEFANNGFSDGYTHNMYIGQIRTFTLRYSYSHHAKVGHTLKSRARENLILYNRIMDEGNGTSSYTVDLPNGGRSYLIGNELQQGPATENPIIVAYGEEGGSNPDQQLYMINNTIVNDRPSGGTFVNVVGSVPAVLKNNIFVGAGTAYNGPGSGVLVNNLVTSDAGLVDRAAFDYHLVAASPAIDAGVDPGSANTVSLAPVAEYVQPHNQQNRTVVGALDSGAHEFAAPATAPPTNPTTLSALATSLTRIDLTWTDTADNEAGFKIERRTGASGSYMQIAIASPNSNWFSDTSGLRPNTQYFYRVRATNAKGDSAYSNQASATTLAGSALFVPLVLR